MANETQEQKASRAASRVGIVRSDVCDKTIRVETERLVAHAKYGKFRRRRTSLQVHDPLNTARVGDTVEITQCRPISKTKSWRLRKVIRRMDTGESAVDAAGKA
jgi:small subunit ribosomal protein S17